MHVCQEGRKRGEREGRGKGERREGGEREGRGRGEGRKRGKREGREGRGKERREGRRGEREGVYRKDSSFFMEVRVYLEHTKKVCPITEGLQGKCVRSGGQALEEFLEEEGGSSVTPMF